MPITLRRIPIWALLAGLVAVSTGLRFWAAHAVPTPWIAPDEFVYAELGKSLWGDGSLAILGEPTRFYTLVVPLVVGLPLRLGDLRLGYELLKLLQAAVMSLSAVPVYLWARSLAPRGWAFAAASLALAPPALVYSGLVMSEVEFYLVLPLAAWATARSLARPTLARQALALGAVVLAAATRLQALVLVPVVLTALLVEAALAREPRRPLRFWPALAGIAAASVAWAAYTLSQGGPATDVLGAYRAAGESHYAIGSLLKYVLWHAGDLVLLSGLVPVAAVMLLLVRAVARREPSDELRAYLAVTASLVVWVVAEVGVFASRHVGRLAERDLVALFPVLCVGFAAWLGRGAPRGRLAGPVVAAASLALVLVLPLGRLVSHAALPDAFTLAPLYRLEVHVGGSSASLAADLAIAALAAGLVLVPARLRWLLPAVLVAGLAAVSVSAGRVVAAESRIASYITVGTDPRWVDRAADAPAVYVYTGETTWINVWQVVFWNRRLARVYDLSTPGYIPRVPGPIPQRPAGPLPDGTLVETGVNPPSAIDGPYVLGPDSLRFEGRRVAQAGIDVGVSLWRPGSPPRLGAWVQDATSRGRLAVFVYACTRGTLRLRLAPLGDAVLLTIKSRGQVVRRIALRPAETWVGTVPLRGTNGVCTVNVDGGAFTAPLVDVVGRTS